MATGAQLHGGRGYGWMDTLRQAAAIKSAPEEWVQRHPLDHDAALAACGLAFPNVPSLDVNCGAHRAPAHKRTREIAEQERGCYGGYGAYGPSTSPSGAPLPSLLVSRGSFQSLDDASPQPSHKVARRLLVASPSASGQSNNQFVQAILLQKQRQLQEQRLQQEQERLQRHAQDCDSLGLQGAIRRLAELVKPLSEAHQLKALPAADVELLEAYLTASCKGLHPNEVVLELLREVQNQIWDIREQCDDSTVAPTFLKASEAAASCCSNSQDTKQGKKQSSPYSEAESQYSFPQNMDSH